MDVLPDVELGPVREREDAHALALVLAGVVEAPQLRALQLRIPAVLRRAEREDALLGAGLLLVAARAAEGRVEAVLVQRLLQALRLPDVGMDRGAMREGIDAHRQRLGIDVDDQVEAELLGHLAAKLDHFAELPRRVDVEQREGRLRRMERLHGEVQHHRAVLADRVEHHRPLALGDGLAHDVDALGFEPLQVRQCLHGLPLFFVNRV